MNSPLHALDTVTTQIKNLGIHDWATLVGYIQNIPYGRNHNRNDLSLVISEGKGTCSSKHALLKKVAEENQIPDIKLILGMYKMNILNTPGIGSILAQNQIAFLPEAHCYLKIEGRRIDVTTANSKFEKIENDLLEEQEISPEDIAVFKVNYHKNFLRNWLQKSDLKLTFDELWSIREKCIQNLSR